MLLQSSPLFGRELHPLPIIETRCILLAELHTPLFLGRTFCGGDVRLELDCVRTCGCRGVDKRMSEVHAPIMRLRHFRNYQRGFSSANLAISYKKISHFFSLQSGGSCECLSLRHRAENSIASEQL